MLKNEFATASLVLAAAVADDGTFTLSYPTGTSVLSFNVGLAGTGHYAILNSNDRWAAADPGIAVSFDASVITVTNQSGYSWPAGTKVDLYFEKRKGNVRIPFTVPLPVLASVANGDLLTEIRPGIAGTLESWEFVTTVPVTTAGKTATLNLEIDTTNVTAGTLVVTSAAATPLGKVIEGALITGANTLTRESNLSIEAASVTTFVEGAGYLVLYIRPTEDTKNY